MKPLFVAFALLAPLLMPAAATTAAAADQCATQMSSCQFPCAATNTEAGLACVNKCIAQRDKCYAAQKSTPTTTPTQNSGTSQKANATQKNKKKQDQKKKKRQQQKNKN